MVTLHDSVTCLDIGNSTSHLGIYKDGELINEDRIASSSLVNNPNQIFDKYDFSKFPLSYCSVLPQAENSLLKYLSFKMVEAFNLNHTTIGNFPITYPHPEEIGQDRLANSFAVFHSTDSPCIVVDVGTATTFDIVTKTGGYEGGVIAPGPQGFLDFLSQNTALLPQVNIKDYIPESLIGKETKQAMLIGAKFGHIAMKEGIITKLIMEIENRFLQSPKVILTGGACTKSNLSDIEYCPSLTIFGLALAFQYNKSNT
ncbi:MAG: type III pantothenate kinase [Opitutae bacterium]|nr:type III pantothenate kinase [Opitutae bacterium]